ncbi:MAG: hypothetical protein K2M12_05130 [Muribaculaceae bacterium]|nr:hypothetical protein [Muribaculaceae bacterium]
MKRLFAFLLAITVFTAVCHATPPNLACEKIFDRKDIRTEGHQLVKTMQPSNYYRSVQADNDPKLLADIKKAFEIDSKRASNIVEGFDGENDYAILQIENNGFFINVSVRWDDNGYVNLYIQSDPAAFK